MYDLLLAVVKEGMVEDSKKYYSLCKSMAFFGTSKVLHAVQQLFVDVSVEGLGCRVQTRGRKGGGRGGAGDCCNYAQSSASRKSGGTAIHIRKHATGD